MSLKNVLGGTGSEGTPTHVQLHSVRQDQMEAAIKAGSWEMLE